MNDLDVSSDYWMIANFPNQLIIPNGVTVDFRVQIIFDHLSESGGRLEKSPAYDVEVLGVTSLDEAAIKIRQRAAELLKRDYPTATVCT